MTAGLAVVGGGDKLQGSSDPKETHGKRPWTGVGMKGIILAGGTGSRLYPITRGVSKQLLPIYDKPMIYYPLSVLMLAGIREILIICTAQDRPQFQRLLQDGSAWGLALSYAIQEQPRGIAEALIIAEHFLDRDACCLILGDNLFFGHSLSHMLQRAVAHAQGSTVFAYRVHNARQYGVIELGSDGQPLSIEEKPQIPRSHLALTGLYFFDGQAGEIARGLLPSARGELEITDVVRTYMQAGQLRVELMGRGFAWMDTGNPESLLQASQFVQSIEQRQGLKIACLEEIAFNAGYISAGQLLAQAQSLGETGYAHYLRQVLELQGKME